MEETAYIGNEITDTRPPKCSNNHTLQHYTKMEAPVKFSKITYSSVEVDTKMSTTKNELVLNLH